MYLICWISSCNVVSVVPYKSEKFIRGILRVEWIVDAPMLKAAILVGANNNRGE